MRNMDYKIWINQKYKNNVFPKLPLIIFNHINGNEEESIKYLSNKIILDELLSYISQNTKINEPKELIKIVKEYVDNHAGIS